MGSIGLTKSAIYSARGTMKQVKVVEEKLKQEATLLKDFFDQNPEYQVFATKTDIGNKYNNTFADFINILNKISDASSSLISSTNSYLDRQEEIISKMESLGN